ncbi:MAG TPA: glycosyltransferase family 4 protein [Planctomycetota bacterium]|nr:glycosyltransferase family 4 protein [Planctomycetota bacterium]
MLVAVEPSLREEPPLPATAAPRVAVWISSLATGGAEQVTISFLERLRERGCDTPLCTLTSRFDGPLAADLARRGVRRLDLGGRRLADPRALFRSFALWRQERWQLVHAHGQDASILAAAFSALSGVPVVLTRHVYEEPGASFRQRRRAALAFVAARRAQAVVAVSHALGEWLERRAGVPRERIAVIPNGVDLRRFAGATPPLHRGALESSLGLAPDAQLVLVPAMLRPGKGHDVLLEAWPEIRERAPRACLLLAGAGELEAELRSAAGRCPDAVRFLGLRDDLPALLEGCDLVVLPSRSDAYPTALLEAAAAGRPVVATRAGGAEEIVQHGRTGLLVPPGDAPALANAVAELLGAPERARGFGVAARRLAAERFDLDLQISRTVELWQRVAT